MAPPRSSPDPGESSPARPESLDESSPRLQAVLGQVRASLRPDRISVQEVRDALAMVQELGFDPLNTHLLALEGRPPEYASPPSTNDVLPT
jgi:hypothetical protein